MINNTVPIGQLRVPSAGKLVRMSLVFSTPMELHPVPGLKIETESATSAKKMEREMESAGPTSSPTRLSLIILTLTPLTVPKPIRTTKVIMTMASLTTGLLRI